MNPQQSFSMNRPIFLVTLFLHILFKIARVFSCNSPIPPSKWRRYWRDEKENFCRLAEKHECQRGKGRTQYGN